MKKIVRLQKATDTILHETPGHSRDSNEEAVTGEKRGKEGNGLNSDEKNSGQVRSVNSDKRGPGTLESYLVSSRGSIIKHDPQPSTLSDDSDYEEGSDKPSGRRDGGPDRPGRGKPSWMTQEEADRLTRKFITRPDTDDIRLGPGPSDVGIRPEPDSAGRWLRPGGEGIGSGQGGPRQPHEKDGGPDKPGRGRPPWMTDGQYNRQSPSSAIRPGQDYAGMGHGPGGADTRPGLGDTWIGHGPSGGGTGYGPGGAGSGHGLSGVVTGHEPNGAGRGHGPGGAGMGSGQGGYDKTSDEKAGGPDTSGRGKPEGITDEEAQEILRRVSTDPQRGVIVHDPGYGGSGTGPVAPGGLPEGGLGEHLGTNYDYNPSTFGNGGIN